MSDQIVKRIDEMGKRIDDLEKNINDLMTQVGVDQSENQSALPRASKTVVVCLWRFVQRERTVGQVKTKVSTKVTFRQLALKL